MKVVVVRIGTLGRRVEWDRCEGSKGKLIPAGIFPQWIFIDGSVFVSDSCDT